MNIKNLKILFIVFKLKDYNTPKRQIKKNKSTIETAIEYNQG